MPASGQMVHYPVCYSLLSCISYYIPLDQTQLRYCAKVTPLIQFSDPQNSTFPLAKNCTVRWSTIRHQGSTALNSKNKKLQLSLEIWDKIIDTINALQKLQKQCGIHKEWIASSIGEIRPGYNTLTHHLLIMWWKTAAVMIDTTLYKVHKHPL